VFDGTPGKVSGFIIACKLYIRMKMREVAVEEQTVDIVIYARRVSQCIEREYFERSRKGVIGI